jgi:hypothetical protein
LCRKKLRRRSIILNAEANKVIDAAPLPLGMHAPEALFAGKAFWPVFTNLLQAA